jgi:hypothetical protein
MGAAVEHTLSGAILWAGNFNATRSTLMLRWLAAGRKSPPTGPPVQGHSALARRLLERDAFGCP